MVSSNIWQMLSKTGTQKKKMRESNYQNYLKSCGILTVMMTSTPNPASAKITGDGDQTLSCKERGNSFLLLMKSFCMR